jgi:hypothetical protein
MKNLSGARLAAAVLIAGSCPAMAVPAGPPLKTLPLQQEIWIGGTIQQGNGQYAPGDYTTLLLDRPAASPCNDKVVTDILLGKAGATDPKLLLPYLGQHVAVRGRVICPDSGIRFTPTPDFVFPVC